MCIFVVVTQFGAVRSYERSAIGLVSSGTAHCSEFAFVQNFCGFEYQSQREAKKYLKKNKELTHCCIVLDDLVTDLPSNQKSLLAKLAMTGRHLNISIIIATQSYKLISRTIRMNLTCLICLHCNQGEVKKIAEESAASNFAELHAECCSKPYGFIHEIVQKPLDKRFRNKFTLEFLDAK